MVALISLALLSGRFGAVLLSLFASFAALREFLTLTTKSRADHLALALAFFLILPAQYLFVWMGWQELFYRVHPRQFLFFLLPIVSALRGDHARFLIREAETQWALMICVFCLSHVPALLSLDLPNTGDRNVLLIAFLVIVVQMGGLLEYFFGRRFGKTRIAPGLSPQNPRRRGVRPDLCRPDRWRFALDHAIWRDWRDGNGRSGVTRRNDGELGLCGHQE